MQMADVYPFKHSGPALVVGSAPCVFEDLSRAQAALPEAKIFAVNEAVKIVNPDFICSYHCEKMEKFASMASGEFTTHSANVTRSGQERKDFTAVEYWWPNLRAHGATSAWFAARVALSMGFDEIILCGCPLNGGDGYAFKTSNDNESMDPRFGLKPNNSSFAVSARAQLASVASSYPQIKSMSGASMAILGAPDFWKEAV